VPLQGARLQGLLFSAALTLCSVAIVVHIWLARDTTPEPVLTCALWLATGVALVAYGRGVWPAAVSNGCLAAVGLLQLVAMRHAPPMAAHPAGDFSVVFESAVRLYRDAGDPYATNPMANSFPFPVYLVVYGIARLAAFDPIAASYAMFGINIVALGLAVGMLSVLARRAGLHGVGGPGVLLWLALLTHRGIAVTFRNGQTSILILLCVVLALWWWLGPTPRPWLAGFFVAGAWMLKPYLLLFAAFYVVQLVDRTSGSRAARLTARVGVWMLAWSVGLLIAVLAWPGGVTITTFTSFNAALTRLQHHYSLNLVSNQSVVAKLAAAAAERGGLPYGLTVDLLTLCACLGVFGLGLYLRRRQHEGALPALAWLAATLVPFTILYVPYYAWILPVLYVLGSRAWAETGPALHALSICATAGVMHLLTSPGFTAGVVALWLTALGAAVRTTER
jgi:hypothetical protein